MTEEQEQRLLEIQYKIYEAIKPFIETMSRIWEQVKELVIKAYMQVKKFLERKVAVRTKSFKKGKRYIHSYKHLELWRLLS